MGRTIPFHFVDVFAVEPLTGNSLTVVDGGANLPLELMRGQLCGPAAFGNLKREAEWLK